jgi:hypothetical protein
MRSSHNCAGFRLRGGWRRPSVLTFAVSRLVLAHESRQTESSETPVRYMKVPFSLEEPGGLFGGW